MPPPLLALYRRHDGLPALGIGPVADLEPKSVARALTAAAEAARGADLICVPTANMVEYNDVQRVLLPSRALENQVFLAYANYIGTEGDLTYGGLSVILGPAGAPVTANPGVADLVTATLVRADIEHSRSQFCYLDDRNPDVY